MLAHYKYPVYKSIFKPLLFWNEIESNIIDNYTKPTKYNKNLQVNKIDELLNKQLKNYSKVTKRNLEETLRFLFDKYREFLFISIRNSKINGYHIYKYDNQNDWHKNLKTFNGLDYDKFYYEYLKKLKRPFIKYLEPKKWTSNNCLLQMSDWSRKEGIPNSYINEILEMIQFTNKKYNGLPDCDLIINRKDFPLLKLDKTPSYTNLYYKSKIINQPNNPWVICSQCTTLEHYDINFPSADEWISVTSPNEIVTDWKQKYATAIWRGSSTGCGTTIKNNNRLKLANISNKWKSNNEFNQNNKIDKTPFLDAGITRFVKKLKVTNQIIYYLNPKDLNFYLSKFMDLKDQTYCKYLLNIEGNVSAYRYGSLFSTNSVVINIKSKYYLWFEPLLTKNEFVELNSDFDEYDIAETIKYLKQNDSKAEEFANNGVKFYNKYLNKDKISEYWFKLMMKINDLQI